MVIPYFKNIRRELIKALKGASDEILVAVYWFTNEELFNLLCKKVRDGVSVSLIVHYDSLNNDSNALNFQSFIDQGGKFYYSDFRNPMHNKFCVIDRKIIINGSYNWTYYAESQNSENIILVTEEPVLTNSFINEFVKLTKKLERVSKVNLMPRRELEDNNCLSLREYMAQDMVYKAQATNRPELVQEALKLARNKIEIQNTIVKLKYSQRKKLKYSIGVSVIHNRYLVLVEKGSSIPFRSDQVVQTTEDNQVSSISKVYYGENDIADLNTMIGEMKLTDLPRKPAGEVKMKYYVTIDFHGKLCVTKSSIDNGKNVFMYRDISRLLELDE